MILHHGYYAARKGERHGDPDSSLVSKVLWEALGHTAPSAVDGVACWWVGQELHARLTVLDIFAPNTRVIVRHWTAGGWSAEPNGDGERVK